LSAGLTFPGVAAPAARPSRLLPLFVALLTAAAAAGHACAHEGMAGMSDTASLAKLGSVSFETSCLRQVRSRFERAVALLHSFWLDESQRAFKDVAAADPDCSMAYWGVALASLHQINGEPSTADLEAGKAALARADKARESTPREAGYIRALHAFYDGYAPEHYLEHAKAYASAMQSLVAAYPRDAEARAFYALGLLAAVAPDDATLENPRRAVAVLYPLLRENPHHPGIAHYIIHACDNPRMAEQGLTAARRYASIAPGVPHALHMPSHIFARLGLWQEDIRSNLASKAAAQRLHASAENRLHAMEFLEYAYLQTGQDDAARALVQEASMVRAADVNPAYPDYYEIVQARLPALLAIETQDWSQAARLQPVAGAGAHSQGLTLLAHTIAAAHRRDAPSAAAAEQAYEALLAREKNVRAGGGLDTLHHEIRAWAELTRGNPDAAVALLRPISARQREVGKGEVELPAGEMMADMALLAGDATQALQAYQASLVSDPNRLNALLGAARAAELSNQWALAKRYYQYALASCSAGGAAPRLQHARDVVNSKPH